MEDVVFSFLHFAICGAKESDDPIRPFSKHYSRPGGDRARIFPAEKGWLEQRLGPGVEIQWFTYNAGPSAMEAIFAGSLDVTYVGPNPRSMRISNRMVRRFALFPARRMPARLCGEGDSPIKTPADFRGKKLPRPTRQYTGYFLPRLVKGEHFRSLKLAAT